MANPVRLLCAVCASIFHVGCPQLLSDDFVVVGPIAGATATTQTIGGAVGARNGDLQVGGTIGTSAQVSTVHGTWGLGGAVGTSNGDLQVGGSNGTSAQLSTANGTEALGGAASGVVGGTGGSDSTFFATGMGGASSTASSLRPSGTGAATGTGQGGAASTDAGCVKCIYCTNASLGEPLAINITDPTVLGVNPALWGPALSPDGLTLYFAVTSDSNSVEQIFVATRASTESVTFSNPRMPFGTVTEARGSPYLSANGLTLYFYAYRSDGNGGRDIWYGTRTDPAGVFSNLQPLAVANTAAGDHLPAEARDRLTLYYVSASARDSTSNDADIWLLSRTAVSEAYASPSPVNELNSIYREGRVALTSDGRVVYFTSDRGSSGAVAGGTNQWEILSATRADAASSFGNVAYVTDNGLNTTSSEIDVALSADNTEFFFVSNRGGKYWIYRSLRYCPK